MPLRASPAQLDRFIDLLVEAIARELEQAPDSTTPAGSRLPAGANQGNVHGNSDARGGSPATAEPVV